MQESDYEVMSRFSELMYVRIVFTESNDRLSCLPTDEDLNFILVCGTGGEETTGWYGQ